MVAFVKDGWRSASKIPGRGDRSALCNICLARSINLRLFDLSTPSNPFILVGHTMIGS
jgi:hypothetical protein